MISNLFPWLILVFVIQHVYSVCTLPQGRWVWAITHWHDDVIKLKHFPRYCPFVRGIHQSPVNFPHKGQARGALVFSLIFPWTNSWANNGDAGDLRRHRTHYDVIVVTKHQDIIYSVKHRKANSGSRTTRLTKAYGMHIMHILEKQLLQNIVICLLHMYYIPVP